MVKLINCIGAMLSSRIINSCICEISNRKTNNQRNMASRSFIAAAVASRGKQYPKGLRKNRHDDVMLLITGSFVSNLIQGALTKLKQWVSFNGLGVNLKNTELVMFTRKRKPSNSFMECP